LSKLLGLRNQHARIPLDSRDPFKSFSSRLPLARRSLREGGFLIFTSDFFHFLLFSAPSWQTTGNACTALAAKHGGASLWRKP
jgi:hypothetical protein